MDYIGGVVVPMPPENVSKNQKLNSKPTHLKIDIVK